MWNVISLRGNQKGYITVLTMMLGAICAFLLMQMLTYQKDSRQQVVISRDLARYSSLMDSVLDYTIYGLKNRWCFDNVWGPMVTGCDLGPDKNSSEALLLTREAYKSLVDYSRRTGLALPPIDRSGRMSATIPVTNFASSHPLYKAISSLISAAPDTLQAIKILVERVLDPEYPTRGNESIVRITVTLNPDGDIPFFRNFKSLSASSLVILSPRELNYFTLIVPNNLHLDGAAGGAGDFSVPAGTTGTGITFASPVYVNNNIYLPNSPSTMATFAGKVYLGSSGGLYRGGTSYAPATPGGEGAQLYSEMTNFGGFARGIDIDDRTDAGLLVFAGLQAAAPASDAARMAQCRQLNYAEMNLAYTADSDLLVKPRAASISRIDFDLGLTKYNLFSPQGYEARKKQGSSGPRIMPDPSNPNPAVLGVSMTTTWTANPTPAPKTVSYEVGMNTYISNLGLGAGNYATLSTGGVSGDNKMEFHLDFSNAPNMSRITQIQFTFNAMDVGYFGGQNRRQMTNGTNVSNLVAAGHSRNLTLTYVRDFSGRWVPDPATASSLRSVSQSNYLTTVTSPYTLARPFPDEPIMGEDYAAFRASCKVQTSATVQPISTAFEPAAWDPEDLYAPETRNSWSFTSPLVAGDPIPGPPPNPDFSDPSVFNINSIAPNCVIPASVNFASGFLVCDNFTIAARTTPLTFVGTLVAKNVSIHPQAVAAGIKFMSIYNPSSVYLLRKNGVLKDFLGNACGGIPSIPVWHPEPDPISIFNIQHCNVASLRLKADPFTWTTFTPDCGVSPTAGQVSCRHRPLRFLSREISRTSDLQ